MLLPGAGKRVLQCCKAPTGQRGTACAHCKVRVQDSTRQRDTETSLASMHLLQALLSFKSSPDEPPADAACAITAVPRQRAELEVPRRGRDQQCVNVGPSSFIWHPFSGKTGTASVFSSGAAAGSRLLLSRLPPLAVSLIWEQLDEIEQRNVRLVHPAVCSSLSRAVQSLQVNGREFLPGDIRRLSSTFPDLNRLTLQLGTDPASNSTAALLQELRGVRLQHLHTFKCDVQLKGDALLAVARFLVHTPTLKVLHLPNQRGCSPADQRVLCAVLEALPELRELDLGGAGSSRSGSNAISPSLMRRITKLLPHLQKLSCNAAAVPDEQLQSLSQLPQLQLLSLSAAGSGRGLSAGLRKLTRLTSLELQHPSLGHGLEGCVQKMTGLQVLALGLCPHLSEGIISKVSGLQHLHKLSLPFPISPVHLHTLSKLPQMMELLSFNQLELDVLGPAHEPLSSVTKLVTSSIDSHGKPLAAVFPALQSVYLRSCGDMEALSLRSCAGGLSVLVAGDCGGLTDEGFAGFRSLRGLTKLHMDNAHQLSDLSFVAVFSSTMPYLHTISLSGCSHITDTALQLLTASCRRLSSITLSNCPQLTDKTLKRLSHCDHLATINIKSCRGVTAEGVAALAAAPQVKAVAVTGCTGVRKSQLRACKQGSKVRVSDSGRSRVSESGRSH